MTEQTKWVRPKHKVKGENREKNKMPMIGFALSILTLLMIAREGMTMQTSDVLLAKNNDFEYHAIYTKKEVKTASDGVEVSVSLAAKNIKTDRIVWKRTLDSIYGDYGSRDIRDLGYLADQFVQGLDINNRPYVFVHTSGNSIYVLNSKTGEDFIDPYLGQFEKVPLSPETKINLIKLNLDMIQAQPGYGVRIRAKNTGKTTIMLNSFYAPFRVEALSQTTKEWTMLGECLPGFHSLGTVPKEAEFDLFLKAELFERMLELNYAVFEPFMKNGKRNMYPMPSMKKARKSKLGKAATLKDEYKEYRLEIIFYLPAVKGRGIKGVFKAYLPVAIKDLASIL